MVDDNPSSMPEDGFVSVAEPVATDHAEAEVRSDQFRQHLKSSARLNQYYNEVVAELRASLERIEAEDQAS